ncbi:bifunctional DNA primase/polymerase [Actinacidiphila rubida]|nr:bifunctional DNA primase/polymerase [Actinacidiphila rubida]
MAPSKGPFAQSFAQYRDAGWLGTLRLPKHAKIPVPTGFTGEKHSGVWPEDSRLHGWSHESSTNIGLRLPENVIAIDIDHYGDKKGADEVAKAEAEWGPLPATWRGTKRGADNPSGKLLFQVPPGLRWPSHLNGDGSHVDIIHHEYRFIVAWPSVVSVDDASKATMTEKWYTPSGVEADRVPRVDEFPELPQPWIDGLQQRAKDQPKTKNLPDVPSIPHDVDPEKPWYINALVKPSATGRGNGNSLSVAGGAAEMFVRSGVPFEVAMALVLNYERASDNPQPDQVVADQLQRMWAKESEKQESGMTERTGYLQPRRGHFGYETRRDYMGKRGPESEIVPFSDFQVQATSVSSADGRTVWTVDLIRDDGKTFRDVELPAEVLNSTATLSGWAMGYQCSLIFSDDRAQRGKPGVRLMKLLRSQNPVECRVISHLGWDDTAKAFITYEGAITRNGVNRKAGVRPAKHLAVSKLVDHFYGFDKTEEETREVLREVLTFHDEEFTSVFTSWLAAGVVKGQLMQRTSMFPIFLVQAASESGKTTGFAQLIKQLFGNRAKEGSIGTRASIRDSLTAHRGAPVHVDDADDIEHVKEVLRQATAEGAVDKKGEDRTSTVRSKLLAPVWISMEGSSLLDDKAMNDRIVSASLPNPKGRMSLHDPTKPQWDDIVDLRNRYSGEHGLTIYAGTLVQMILKAAEERLSEFTKLRKSSGRHHDKMAILRVGARILSDVTDDPSHVERVDAWVSSQVDTGNENALTMKLIPAALMALGAPALPIRINQTPHYGVVSPVLVAPAPSEGVDAPSRVWVNVGNLAAWWERYAGNKLDPRTETKSALAEQAKRLPEMKGESSGDRNVDWIQAYVTSTVAENGKSRPRPRYQRLPDAISARLLDELGIGEGTDEKVSGGNKLNPAQSTAVERA